MEQLKDFKNLDIYYDDTIAAVQKGFENYADRSTDDHCVDDRPDETTHSVIIEKEDEDCNSASNAEQNDYNVPVRKVNEEMKGLENDTDDLAKELPFTVNEEMKGLENDTDDLAKELPFTVLVNDHDGEQFLENAGSIMDVQNKKEIDTLNGEIDDTDDLAKELPFTEPPDNHDNSQSKMAVKKKRRQSSKLCSPIILAAFIFIRFTGAQGSDPGQQSCSGESAAVLNGSSVSFNDFDRCTEELEKLGCTFPNLKTCIRDVTETSLWAVCTTNICFHGQACPRVTENRKKELVVESRYNQCQNCSDTGSLQDRLNEYGNVGAECLVISGTTSQPTMPSISPPGTPSINPPGTDVLVLSITIPLLCLVLIGIGIGRYCLKNQRGRNNKHNRNGENSGDQGQNREQRLELLTLNGGQGAEHRTQNGRQEVEHLTQNGRQEVENLTPNGRQEVEYMTPNGRQVVEHLTQNGGQGVIEQSQP